MNSVYWSHPLRIARPLGLLPNTRTQLRLTKFGRGLPLRYSQRPGVRPFSVAAVINTTVHTIIGIHTITHIPWFILIPCVSIGINAAFRLPINIYTHKLNLRQTKSFQVLQGWGWRVPQDIHKEGIPRDQGEKEAKKRMSEITSRINHALGTQTWKMYSSLLTVPVWLIGIESIRKICGGPRGLLGSFVLGGVKKEAKAPDAQQDFETAVLQADMPFESIGQGFTVDPPAASAMFDNVGGVLDPSIMFEGCLWFRDLSVADPYHILPIALSAMLVANMLPKGGIPELLNLTKSEDEAAIGEPPSKWRLRLRRGAVLIALMTGPITADMPAALHYYWLTSAAVSYFTHKSLSRSMPIDMRHIKRCTGTEVNIIQPKQTRKTSSQAKKKTTE